MSQEFPQNDPPNLKGLDPHSPSTQWAADNPLSSYPYGVRFVGRRNPKPSTTPSPDSKSSLIKGCSLSEADRVRLCLSPDSLTHRIRTRFFSTQQAIETFLRSLDTSGDTH